MNDFPQIECKKHAYRQTQDGVVISFVVHPDDVSAELAAAPLGTRYTAVLVEMNDNETVKPPTGHKLANKLGIRCNEPAFRRFLWESGHIETDMLPTEDDAIAAVRELCGVDSRSNIDGDPEAEAKCRKLLGDYEAWNTL
jgi:hypothetical protein